MKTNIGEYIVGAYLKIIKYCDFVDYNVRHPGGGLKGLNELDVVGLDFKNKKAYLCEVTTHITGLLYKDNKTTVKRIKNKHKIQKEYAEAHLSSFPVRYYMFWSGLLLSLKVTLLANLKRLMGWNWLLMENTPNA